MRQRPKITEKGYQKIIMNWVPTEKEEKEDHEEVDILLSAMKLPQLTLYRVIKKEVYTFKNLFYKYC
jgi:hypothetical protein